MCLFVIQFVVQIVSLYSVSFSDNLLGGCPIVRDVVSPKKETTRILKSMRGCVFHNFVSISDGTCVPVDRSLATQKAEAKESLRGV